MHDATAARLIEINRVFYAEFGPAFAATRRRIQNGVRRVLESLPDLPGARWLDLGCGSGALAREWLRAGRSSAYLGVDFSAELLAEAAAEVGSAAGAGGVAFLRADLSDPAWVEALAPGFAGVLSFAVFHHLPSRALRARVLRQVRGLLAPGGVFIHSEWQFQNAPRLMERRVPWQSVGLADADLEPGDTLLDWRYHLPGQPAGRSKQGYRDGLRYVHLFERAELADLAREAGFRVVDEFESDGQGGRLSLYQTWEAV